ncbi:SRPBCC family protein [Hellea balneolensis]|uniref:SRPBCC family protein n=1 Tax=Hellea balneolensis TaxID=287478 RepID=UPI00138AAE2C|nr:SRPBCC family protein [Hellea balneolensis]
MKWLLRGIFAIFLIFGILIGVGFFMPATQSIERSIEVEAYPEDVFPFLNNLQAYSQWSPLYAQIADAQIIYGGAEVGIGQTMAWQGSAGNYPFGSQEIIQSQAGEFVQVKVNLSGQEATATHAILPLADGDGVTVLTKSEIALGGFPYLDRVRSRLRQGWFDDQFDQSLMRLKTISENYAGG